MTTPQYSHAPSGDDVDIAAGVSFADPFRWLEAETAAVRSWQAAQNRLSDDYSSSWAGFAALEESLGHYFVYRISTPPRFVAGKWFRAVQPSDSSPLAVCLSDTPYGAGREIPILASDQTDLRCPPWQALKFVARLQAAVVGDQRPRLLRVRDNAGHGEATAKEIQVSSYTGWLAFVMRELGMELKFKEASE